MPYTEEDGGLINNFAVEPKVYSDDTKEIKSNNLLLIGGVGLLLVLGLITVAFTIS